MRSLPQKGARAEMLGQRLLFLGSTAAFLEAEWLQDWKVGVGLCAAGCR